MCMPYWLSHLVNAVGVLGKELGNGIELLHNGIVALVNAKGCAVVVKEWGAMVPAKQVALFAANLRTNIYVYGVYYAFFVLCSY